MYPAFEDRYEDSWDDYTESCMDAVFFDEDEPMLRFEDLHPTTCNICERSISYFERGICWQCTEVNDAWLASLEEEYDTQTQFVIEETWGYFEDGDLRVPAGVSRMLWVPN